MSALLAQLAQNGVSNEDLEKAASAELFYKVAAAEGIDLEALDLDQVQALYNQFESDVLPGLVGKEASADDIQAKLASLSDDDVFALFEKQAAYEGFTTEDLEQADDEKLAAAFEHFVHDMLPAMAANDFEPVNVEGSDKVAEAQAKLAEASILGTHMADAFHGRLEELGTFKGASATEKILGALSSAATGKGIKKGLEGMREGRKLKGAGETALLMGQKGGKHSKRYGEIVAKRMGAADKATSQGRKDLAKGIAATGALYGGGGAAALGGAGYAAGRAGKKEAAAFEALAMQKAAEILEANGINPETGEEKQASFDDVVTARAAEILEANGYTFED